MKCNLALIACAFMSLDRKCADKSRAMFRTYSNHYSKDASDEVIARRWNSGPRGDRKKATEAYWKRVQKAMN
jgi:hypothetical protein